jgi:hypothetical protein
MRDNVVFSQLIRGLNFLKMLPFLRNHYRLIQCLVGIGLINVSVLILLDLHNRLTNEGRVAP